jgi:hypothetical protein
MLREFLQSVLTRANTATRQLGYVQETVSTYARYRRVRHSWEPHLSASRRFIEQAVAATPGRSAVIILGSGWGLDLPLSTLEQEYQQVYLVDIVHPHPVRKRLADHTTLHLIEADLTGIVAQFSRGQDGSSVVAPEFPMLPRADLIISANLLSQLPILPTRYAERRQWLNIHQLKKQVLLAHVGWLAAQATPVCLVSDYRMNIYDRQGVCLEQEDLFDGLALKSSEHEWEWEIAPFGEVARNFRITHQVRALHLQPRESCFMDRSMLLP